MGICPQSCERRILKDWWTRWRCGCGRRKGSLWGSYETRCIRPTSLRGRLDWAFKRAQGGIDWVAWWCP